MPGFRLESPMISNTVAVKEPLAPQILSKAGVPLDEALWFNRLPSALKVHALRVPRGEAILKRVREFTQQAMPQQGMSSAL